MTKGISLLTTSRKNLVKNWNKIQAPCPRCGAYHAPYLIDKIHKANDPEDFRLFFTCCEGPYESWHGVYVRSLNSMIAFRKLCSKVSRAYAKGEFSSTEKALRASLRRLGWWKGWLHNYPVKCVIGGKKRTYRIDLFHPKAMVGLEGDGTVWHKLWGVQSKDAVRDNAINEQYGIRIVRFPSSLKSSQIDSKIMEIPELVKDFA